MTKPKERTDEAYARLADLYKRVEELLRRYGIPDPVSVPMGGRGFLGVERIHGSWRICRTFEGVVAPILECPISVRIRAAELLPTLFQSLQEARKQRTEEIEIAVDILTKFCQQVEHELPA